MVAAGAIAPVAAHVAITAPPEPVLVQVYPNIQPQAEDSEEEDELEDNEGR